MASLTLVAGPIGNLGDLSERARKALAQADFWVVEDTRVAGKLRSHLSLPKPMVVLNEHAGERQVSAILARLESGESAALTTDAGTPGISDPGALLVDAAYERGLVVDAIPGPSAVTHALMLSGFFAQRFAFLGFLPRKPSHIREVLEPFEDSAMTLVVFESPFRVDKLLPALHASLGSRRFAICRELTKLHQQVWRGVLPCIPSEQEVPRKGEFTLVVEGKRRPKPDEGL